LPMTTIRTLATHEVVRLTYPRPVTERDELGMAVGKAIDSAMSRYGYESSLGRRPTGSSMTRFAVDVLNEELRDADLQVDSSLRAKIERELQDVLRAFRSSELFGLPRPRTRMLLLGGEVGVYAQPDYWDGRGRIFEMKSYRAIPPPPDVALQLRLFQLAFSGFAASLVCIDRHANPVATSTLALPELSPDERAATISLAHRCGLENGREKVLEYIDSPMVAYPIPAEGRAEKGSP
jgi:hypothetical protein